MHFQTTAQATQGREHAVAQLETPHSVQGGELWWRDRRLPPLPGKPREHSEEQELNRAVQPRCEAVEACRAKVLELLEQRESPGDREREGADPSVSGALAPAIWYLR